MGFVNSDLWKVRQKWGKGLIIWPGVTVVAMNKEGQVWLGKRTDNGSWNIVGGYFEMGDSAETCARREVEEETGHKVADMEMIGVITDPKLTHIVYPHGDETQSPCYVFVAILKDAKAAPDEEHSEFKWVEPEEVANYVTAGSMSTAIAMEMYENWLETEQFQVK